LATDATGSPTALGIPKYNTSADAPSGLGFNAAMDTIDTLIAARLKVTGAPADADVPVWDSASSTWKPSSTKPPAVGAMVRLSDTTLGAGAATIDISSISSAYAHLRLVIQGRGDTVANNVGLFLRLNNDSGASQYTYAWLLGSGVTASTVDNASSTQMQVGNLAAASASATLSGSAEILIPNYTNTTFIKRVQSQFSAQWGSGAGSWQAGTVGGYWANTAAVNRITLIPGAGNFVAGTRVTLYGWS
jgi:hypothetical protein